MDTLYDDRSNRNHGRRRGFSATRFVDYLRRPDRYQGFRPFSAPGRRGGALQNLLLGTIALLVVGCGGQAPDTDAPAGPQRTYDRGPLELVVVASSDTITTAESLVLTLKATLDEGHRVKFPTFPEPEEASLEEDMEAPQAFTLLDYEDAPPSLLDDGRILRARSYFLEPFLEGAYVVPSLELRFGTEEENDDTWLRLDTEELQITVVSVLPPDAELALQDIAGPVSVQDPTPWGWYLFWLVVILGAAVAFYYYRFVRETPGPPPPPPVPPHQRALDALEAIAGEKLVEKGLYKEYYIRVSAVLRSYMEDQFGLNAPERTTEEFLQELQHSALIGLQEQLLLKEFLRHCDLVKFAKTEPTSEEIQKTFDTCKQFVKDTAAAQRQAVVEALGGA
jgi:hypothetical protein